MAKKIAVLGATGNIGSKLAQHLLADGHHVVAVGRHADKLESLVNHGASVAIGDQADAEFLTSVLGSVDAAYLLMPPFITAPDFMAYQASLGEALITAIKDSKIKQLVFLSSQGADQLESKTGPIKGVGLIEVKLRELSDVDITTLRPTYFMENNLGNIHQIQNGGTVYSGFPADFTMSMIATKDIAVAVAEALKADVNVGYKVVDLLGPEDLSPSEMNAIEGELLGIAAKYVQVPYAVVGEALKGYGIGESLANLYVEMYEGAVEQHIFRKTVRTAANTTSTTYREFLSGVLGR
jgi:uncharacterized protein YbjT (DUF2867 family)